MKNQPKLQLGFLFTLIVLFSVSCKKEDDENNKPSDTSDTITTDIRKYKMGFSTWSFGPDYADVDSTYEFITKNANIYSEHIDNKIPWKSLFSGTDFPIEVTQEIDGRVARKIAGHDLLVSVSLLNTLRKDLAEDVDGSTPIYSALNSDSIENAYFNYLVYIIDKLNPTYFVAAIEVNELYLVDKQKWNQCKLLMTNIRTRLKSRYPTLKISESVTLHNWFKPNVSDPNAFIKELSDYVNTMDFAAISFYPFFKGLHTKADFQTAFDFLHAQVKIPIAFVETTHLANDLEVSALNIDIKSDEVEQKAYLETLISNAENNDYHFFIWWCFRDYDKLWNTFPTEVKDLGKLWRDTGLLDENGYKRPSFYIWDSAFKK